MEVDGIQAKTVVEHKRVAAKELLLRQRHASCVGSPNDRPRRGVVIGPRMRRPGLLVDNPSKPESLRQPGRSHWREKCPVPVTLWGHTPPELVQPARLFGDPPGRLCIQFDHLLGQRQALHGKAARRDADSPFAHTEATLPILPRKAQSASPRRLQIDPDESLDLAAPDTEKGERLLVQTPLQVFEPSDRPQGHSKHSTLQDCSRRSPLGSERIGRF